MKGFRQRPVAPLSLPTLFLSSGAHELEAAQTLIQAGQFVVILLIARALAELMVRLRLPAILGELVAGVLIGVSGLHLIQPPELGGELNRACLKRCANPALL